MPVWGADAMKMSWLFHADVLSGNAQLMVIAAGYQYGRHGCGEQSCDWHARSYKPLINRGRARRHALPLTLNLCIYKSECWHARSYKPLINRGRARRHALPLTLNLCIYKSECQYISYVTPATCIPLIQYRIIRIITEIIIIHVRIIKFHWRNHIFISITFYTGT